MPTSEPQFLVPFSSGKNRFPVPAKGTSQKTKDAIKKWKDSQYASFRKQQEKKIKPTKYRVKAIRFSLSELSAIVNRGARTLTSPEQLVNILYTAGVIYEYSKLRSKYSSLLKRKDKKATKEWSALVKHFSDTLKSSGLSGIKEDDLNSLNLVLTADKEVFGGIVKLFSSGKQQSVVASPTTGSILPTVGRLATADYFDDLTPIVTPVRDLCNNPIQDDWTKSYGGGFDIPVTIPYPCGITRSGLRLKIKWCNYTINVYASYSFDLTIQYKIDCRGMTVWGCADAQACVGVSGVGTVCAGCRACVQAALGVVSSAAVSGQCEYGAGVVASLTCRLGSLTVFYGESELGMLITAPCP